MKEKILAALFTGSMAYIITVIISLFLQHPLPIILFKGIIALVLVSLTGWVFMVLLDNLSTQTEGDQSQLRVVDGEKDETKQETKKQSTEEEEEFSPLNPTVLELSEQETD